MKQNNANFLALLKASFLLCLFMGVSVQSKAYTMSATARGNCPEGYYRAVTDPAHDNQPHIEVTEYLLPNNVCVRRISGVIDHKGAKNFSKNHFAVIEGETPVTLDGARFEWVNFEPIIGHYSNSVNNYIGSTMPRSPYYGDYSGVHPILISVDAHASIKYENGLYLLDRQTSAMGRKRCPADYSTVGESHACYSQNNGLKANNDGKLELIELGSFEKELPNQKCPLGMARVDGLGSDGGICTSVEALHGGLSNYGMFDLASDHCLRSSYNFDNEQQCLPELTAVYCYMDAASVVHFEGGFSIGRKVMIHPTYAVIADNAGVNFQDYYDLIIEAEIAADRLSVYGDSTGSTRYFVASPVDTQPISIFHLFTRKACMDVYESGRGGWSVVPEPLPW